MNYYVSVVDGPKYNLLSGPYPTHIEALAALPKTQERAVKLDPQAHFYSFGTVAMPKTCRKKGLLDKQR